MAVGVTGYGFQAALGVNVRTTSSNGDRIRASVDLVDPYEGVDFSVYFC